MAFQIFSRAVNGVSWVYYGCLQSLEFKSDFPEYGPRSDFLRKLTWFLSSFCVKSLILCTINCKFVFKSLQGILIKDLQVCVYVKSPGVSLIFVELFPNEVTLHCGPPPPCVVNTSEPFVINLGHIIFILAAKWRVMSRYKWLNGFKIRWWQPHQQLQLAIQNCPKLLPN